MTDHVFDCIFVNTGFLCGRDKVLSSVVRTMLRVTSTKLGYFHRWEQWSNVVDASPLRGGHPGGQNGQVFGIVEFEDGVRRVGPSSIKFCDEENAILCEMAKHHEALRRGEANAES